MRHMVHRNSDTDLGQCISDPHVAQSPLRSSAVGLPGRLGLSMYMSSRPLASSLSLRPPSILLLLPRSWVAQSAGMKGACAASMWSRRVATGCRAMSGRVCEHVAITQAEDCAPSDTIFQQTWSDWNKTANVVLDNG